MDKYRPDFECVDDNTPLHTLRHRAKAVVLHHLSLPYPCYFCCELVEEFGNYRGQGNVHHIDGNKRHNVFKNLAVVHVSCHHRYHNKGNSLGPEARKKISDKAKERFADPAKHRKFLEAQAKRKPSTMTAESKQRMSDKLKAWHANPASAEAQQKKSELMKAWFADPVNHARWMKARNRPK